jgi:hypothetical protein
MTRMISIRSVEQPEFRVHDKVAQAEGLYQKGIPEVFLRAKEDIHWAETRERATMARCHPVQWLHHPDPPALDIY